MLRTKAVSSAVRVLVAGVLVAGVAVAITGCDGFFVDTHKTASTTSSTGDYVYAVNSVSNTLTGYVVGTGTLTGITGAPYTLAINLGASSIAVTRDAKFVYAGGSGGIVCYSIGTAGALTAVSGGGATAQNSNFVSLDTSPDGTWLFGLDSVLQQLYVFQINATTGALVPNTPLVVPTPTPGTPAARMVRIAPNSALVAVALSYGGDVLYTFNTTTGVLTQSATIQTPSSAYFDNAVGFDSTSGYLLIGRGGASGTSGIQTYSVNSAGQPGSSPTFTASGNTPFSFLLDSTGANLYVANRGDSTISGYGLTSGKLTPLAGSPYGSGSAVAGLVLDKTGKYVVSVGAGGGSDVTLYGFDAVTPARLDALTIASSGSSGLIAIAATR